MAFENIEKMITEEVMKSVERVDLKPIVKQAVLEMTPRTIEIDMRFENERKKHKTGLQHAQFEQLLKYAACGLNSYLVGPAGSGKTRAADEVAQTLGLEFYSESVCQQSSAALLKGYMDANGSYVSTNFRRAFEEGGIFLLDEIDAGNPNVLTVLNAAVAVDAGQRVSFPDGMVARHEKFICIAAANTFGTGSDRQYVGRNPLDAASLDRFVFIEWGYDEILESEIAKAAGVSEEWFKYVCLLRRTVNDLKLRMVISPRATLFGGKLIRAGFSAEEAVKAAIFKGVDAGTVDKILSAAPVPNIGDEKPRPAPKKAERSDYEWRPAGEETPERPAKPRPEKGTDTARTNLINAIKELTNKRGNGARRVDSLILCRAMKSSGKFSSGRLYLQTSKNDNGDPCLWGVDTNFSRATFISSTSGSNFSRKFEICLESTVNEWARDVPTTHLDALLESSAVHDAVNKWFHDE